MYKRPTKVDRKPRVLARYASFSLFCDVFAFFFFTKKSPLLLRLGVSSYLMLVICFFNDLLQEVRIRKGPGRRKRDPWGIYGFLGFFADLMQH